MEAAHGARRWMKGMTMRLKLTEALRNEWDTRSIGGVIPELDAMDWRKARTIEVDAALAAKIRADCLHQIDPKAIDATAAERAPYRGLLRQIDAA